MIDPRFKTTGFLLKKKELTYKSMFKHLPATVIAKELGITWNKMSRIKRNPGHWTVTQIYALAELLGMKAVDLFKLIDESI